MKASLRLLASTALLASALALPTRAEDTPPGLVEFGSFAPPKGGGQFVEVNVKSSLLALAARLTEKAEPEVADLLRNLKSVRVNVIGLDDANRAELSARLKAVRSDLESKGWDRIVTVQEKQQEVGVYLKQRDAEVIEGVVVTVVDEGREAVFVNVVGDIRPEKIATLGERLHIEPLKRAGEALAPKPSPAGAKS